MSSTEFAKPLKVLVADDALFNRRVTEAMLTSFGCQVTVVGDGREACEALERTAFDVVLMDVQMPVMDGMAATRAIRISEALGPVPRRVPILALTAMATQADEERCLAAGMDGYLSKPVETAMLERALNQVQRSEQRSAALDEGADVVLDTDLLLIQVGSSRELMQEVVQIFLEDAPAVCATIQEAVDREDSANLERSAHRLKGALLTLAANRAAKLALELETLGREGRMEEAARTSAGLELELARLLVRLREVLEGPRAEA